MSFRLVSSTASRFINPDIKQTCSFMRPPGLRTAHEAVRNSRWCVRPNEGFVAQLLELEKTLRGRGKNRAKGLPGCFQHRDTVLAIPVIANIMIPYSLHS